MEILEQTSLFSGMPLEDIENILECVQARRLEYEKGETVIWEGDIVTDIGIVLAGRGHSVKENASGKPLIVTLLEKGSFIGILLAAGRERKSPVSVQAREGLTVLFISLDRIIGRCAKSCPRHDVFLRNCFNSIAEKSMDLYDRIDCLIRPTIREKIIAYLSILAKENRSSTFMSPLDRNAMAEYIHADRSALSRELSRMKRDGLIDYYKNSFKLL